MIIRQFNEIVSNDEGLLPGRVLLGGGVHPSFEVFCVTAGGVSLEWIGVEYKVEAPAVFIIAANTPHQLYRTTGTFASWYIELDVEEADEKPALETIAKWNEAQCLRADNQSFTLLTTLTLQMIHESMSSQYHQGKSDFGKKIVSLELRKLFILINEGFGYKEQLPQALHLAKKNEKRTAQEHIFSLICYIESNYAAPITLAILSKMSGFTSAYIIKLFKEAIGMTPIQYVQQLRIHAALSYLRTTDLEIQEIAIRSGFSNLHYFSRLFKQKMQKSPSEWRKWHYIH